MADELGEYSISQKQKYCTNGESELIHKKLQCGTDMVPLSLKATWTQWEWHEALGCELLIARYVGLGMESVGEFE